MSPKVLFVLTSHNQKGETGQPTGYYLAEVAHPWHVLHHAGYEIDFVSPQGGEPPVDGLDLKDAVNKEFWDNAHYREKLAHTLRPQDVQVKEYAAIFYAGGHGTMWDFPDNAGLQAITAQLYEAGGIVGAVCHGPAGLVNVRLSDGSYLVADKRVNGFSNAEEAAVGLTDVVPFLLEDQLIAHGGLYEKSGLWQAHVTVDGRLVTGQNPASASLVGQEILKLLQR